MLMAQAAMRHALREPPAVAQRDFNRLQQTVPGLC